MEQIKLEAQKRTEVGKKVAKHLRKEGLVPAVVYKEGKEALAISVSERSLVHALHTEAGENVIINLEISGVSKNKKRTVIVKEIQHHPIKDSVLHVDFHEISLTEVIEVKVPVETKGEPIGVKRDEGILEHMLWELEIECLPTDIPEKISVDVSNLEIGDAIHVKELTIPEKVKVLNDPEAVVVSVEHPKLEEVKEEVEIEGEAAEPELIRKERKEEEEIVEEEQKKEE